MHRLQNTGFRRKTAGPVPPRRVGAVYDRTSLERVQSALIERTYIRSSSFASFVIATCIAVLFGATGVLASAVVDAPLADAAMHGDIDAVRSLLEQSADVDAPQGDGTTALHWAAYRDDAEIARLLIEAGADLDAKTRLGDLTPLLLAAKNGNAALIEILLEAGGNANDADANGTTPLMYSAASGNTDAVKLLLEGGAEANATDSTNGQTALMFAAAQGRREVVRILAAGGADPDILTKVSDVIRWRDRYRDEDGKAAVKEDRPEAFSGGFTALHFAAREGRLQVAKELVAAGADMNLVAASDDASPLTTAIINGRLDVASFLLDQGADPNLSNKDGVAPLYATIDARWAERTWYPAPSVEEEKTDYLDLLQALLEAGADPDRRLEKKPHYRTNHGDWIRPEGATAFWLAAKANDVPAMKLLVGAGANPTIPTEREASPLLAAAGWGYEPQVTNFAPNQRLAAVKYLVEEVGADVTLGDNQGYTPLHGAALTIDRDLILYLISVGADVRARATQVFGGAGRADQEVEGNTGDTVADMANGPKAHNMQYPETVEFLEALGSENSNHCRASTCVVKTLETEPEP